jgi:methylmalonyl-CoA/ethylmalonyl-CoA epimerase
LERAVEFYRDKLGIKHLFTVPNMAFFDCDGIRLMLGLPEGIAAGKNNSVIYFKVADIHEAADQLSKQGVKFESKPHVIARMETYDLWMGFFRDPDNNLLSIMSEIPKKA